MMAYRKEAVANGTMAVRAGMVGVQGQRCHTMGIDVGGWMLRSRGLTTKRSWWNFLT